MKNQNQQPRHQVTTYSTSMASISDEDGTLVAVFNGPRSLSNAVMFCEMLDMVADAAAAGITDIEALFRNAEAHQVPAE